MKSFHNFRVLGLDIEFPFEPYGIQKSMLNTVTKTLTNKTHSLIESPTGTGKTLVLLCSSIAWQKKSKLACQPFLSMALKKKQAEERREFLRNKACTCKHREKKVDKEFDKNPDKDFDKDFKKEKDKVIYIQLDDEPDEPTDKPDKKTDTLCTACAALKAEETFMEILGEDSVDGDGMLESKFRVKVPRIYYGTRTHKQITQVIRELNKTTYSKDLRMCILSSRERTCINDDVRDKTNRNDLCQELIKSKQSKEQDYKKRKLEQAGCSFYQDSNLVGSTFEGINDEFNKGAWDIEDAAQFGRKNASCPYYGTRSLQQQADITFCPYNYLLDPIIRKTLDINLSNAIIVFDEAHNIEDICRDSASFVVDTRQIDDLLDTIQSAASYYLQGSTIMDAYNFFKDKLLNLKGYLKTINFDESLNDKFSEYTERRILTQAEMHDHLEKIGFGPDSLPEMKENLKALRGDEEDEKSTKNSDNKAAMNFAQMQTITQLVMTLEFMYLPAGKNIDDFRAVVAKGLDKDAGKPNYRRGGRNEDKTPALSYQGEDNKWQFSLLCMNSGIAFERIHKQAWSVIVASGTLSPIESLKSELGCAFTNVFEGSHVIQSERVFASILSRGPKSVDLNCAFTNSLKLEFQDEVGNIVRDMCKAIPHGVLCFFPSYDRMENFYHRWQTTGIMKDVFKTGKKLFRERKNLTADQFERELENYNEHANKKGALLFAVFRGKVSEGIDFADNAARAVITIGIPYPNIKEVNIGLKKDYNDVTRQKRPHLMTGRDWYASQAFRALNQALGRCIRHKDDWGAIIMIDSRLKYSNSLENISKWLRKVLNPATDYPVIHDCLKNFVQVRSLCDRENSFPTIEIE